MSPEEDHEDDQSTSPLKLGFDRWGCSAWRRKGSRESIVAFFQYLKGAYGKAGEELYVSICSDRTRGNKLNFKLKCQIQIRYQEEILYSECGEALEQVDQTSCGCPIPGSVESQVGWGFEQPGLVVGVTAHSRDAGIR